LVAVSSTRRAPKPTPEGGGLRRAAPQADATSDLYERYSRQIYTYCFHQLGSREEAEDATQSTFLNAFRGLKRGIDPEFETAWLYKIAQNVCLTRQRSTSRRRRVEASGDLEAVQDFVPAHQADPDDLISLPEALVAMPEQQRRALLLREWQGLSYKEIADELELTQAAVETLLFRARRSLVAGLTEELPRKQSKRLASRLRVGGDAGSLLVLAKTLLVTGGAKVAATVATVAATSVVAATPATRHAVEQLVAPAPPPHHQARPQLVLPPLVAPTRLSFRAHAAEAPPPDRRRVLREGALRESPAERPVAPPAALAPVAPAPGEVEPKLPEPPAPPASAPAEVEPPEAAPPEVAPPRDAPPEVAPPVKLPVPAPASPLPPAADGSAGTRLIQDASPAEEDLGQQRDAAGAPPFVPPGQARKPAPPSVDPGPPGLERRPLPPGQAKKAAAPAVPVGLPPVPPAAPALPPVPVAPAAQAPPPASQPPAPQPSAPQPSAPQPSAPQPSAPQPWGSQQPPAPSPAAPNAGGKGNDGPHGVAQGHRK
jgi:RNA polymerase sigma factor (sigma-70 family)